MYVFSIKFCCVLDLDKVNYMYLYTCSVHRSCPYDGDFKCNDGKCLRSYDVCDGRSECRDGEDELNCGKYMHTYVSLEFLANTLNA